MVGVRDTSVMPAWNKSFLGRVCDDALREQLLDGATVTSYSPGDVVHGRTFSWEENKRPVTLVVTGVFREFLGAENGRQVTVQYFRPGDVWGLVRVLDEAPVTKQRVTYQSLTPSTVISIGRRTFLDAVTSRPELAVGLARELARLISKRTRLVEMNMFADMTARIALHIHRLAVEDENGIPTVWLSQQEIADAVGSVREIVTRIIGDFRAQGIVRTSSRRLEILDMDALAAEILRR